MCDAVRHLVTEQTDGGRLLFVVYSRLVYAEEGRVAGSDFCQESLISPVCDGFLSVVGDGTVYLFRPLM